MPATSTAQTAQQQRQNLNPYAAIITDEAQRRGIDVEVIDAAFGYFRLSWRDNDVYCRESLSDRTSAVALSLCDDKSVTLKLLKRAGLNVPAQMIAGSKKHNADFLQRFGKVAVKPAHGEQGAGVSVDITQPKDLEEAIDIAARVSRPVLIEQFVDGEDLRVIVIDGEVVAAAVRRAPRVTGDGEHTLRELVAAQSERRERETGGESHIPLDAELKRCIKNAGYDLNDVVPENEELIVREEHNVHMGGTIEDITPQLSPVIAEAAVKAAAALRIPVVGMDFIAPTVDSDEYIIIEANERPGLANHEPQPTAQRFIDYLFPETMEKHR